MRDTRHRTRRAIALGLASAALGTAFSLGSPGAAMAAPIPPSGPNQASTSGSAPVFGSAGHPQSLPHDMQEGLDFWRDMGWPNWHNIGGRDWFTASVWLDPATHAQHRSLVFTGGQYQDRDDALRDFMHNGHASTSSTALHYMGTFQEYNTTVYTTTVNSAVPRRDARRIVRAVNTGDVWWTDDHYSTFHYLGQP